jgi:cell wall-associated NlpC family hydrolase
MRRLIIVLSAFLFASFLASLAALSLGAQTPSEQYAGDDAAQQESATQEPSEGTTPEAGSDTSKPYYQVVDNAAAERFEAPGWEEGPANDATLGETYAYAAPSNDAGPASFTVTIPETGYYTVYARWPGGQDNTTAARFGVDAASGTRWSQIDQRADAGNWAMIGVYEMEQGERVLQISRNSAEGRVVADAVMVVENTLSGLDEQPASAVNPDELAGTEASAGDDSAFSTQNIRNPTGRDVVRVARRHLGTRYVSSPPGPCRAFRAEDCSCLTKLVFRKFGQKLPDRGPDNQWRYGRKIPKSKLRAGDLVFFDENNDNRMGDHDLVSIYSGNREVILASNYRNKVIELKMRWLSDYYGAKRLRLR